VTTPEKKFARLSGRASRQAWEELQRLRSTTRFDQILAYLDTVDGTLRLSDVERAATLAAEGHRSNSEGFIPGVGSLSSALIQALHEALDAAIAAQRADKGNMQVLDRHGALRIVAHRGFGRDFLDHFAYVRVDGSSACARSFRSGSPLVISDVFEDPAFAPHLEVAKSSGFRAVQSIPLLSRSGSVIGMLSVHYESPLQSSDWRMQSLQESALRAALVLGSGLGLPAGSTAAPPDS
jgi:hypothetical protein